MTHILLLRGIPASGKSSWAKSEFDGRIYSTDEFWGTDYDFDITRLAEAHEWNRRRVETTLRAKYPHICVDNTNITAKSVAAYFDLAIKYGATVSRREFNTPLEECLRRNAMRTGRRHVPESVIRRMHSQMESDRWNCQLEREAAEKRAK